MKKRLWMSIVAFAIVSLVTTIIVYDQVTYAVSDEELLYYKSAEFCSSLVRQRVKSPLSYRELRMSGVAGKASETDLKSEYQKDTFRFYKDSYEKGHLKLYKFDIAITFSAKNSFGVDLQSNAFCEFIIYRFRSSKFHKPDLETLIIGDNIYKDFSRNRNTPDVKDFTFWDKLSYLLNKDKVSIVY